MTLPLVSIAMITYNHASHISKAIEGVVKQRTNFNFELVIGEDCSNDGTRDIVFKRKKKYSDIIRVITSENNVGMKQNVLRTIGSCRGKYIAFCEGDDYWHNPEKLQMQVDFLEENPGYGLVYSDYDNYNVDTGERIENYLKSSGKKINREPTIIDMMTDQAWILTCTVMTRRDLIHSIMDSDEYLYKSDELKMGDTQLWAEISMKSKIRYMDCSFSTHNILEESATQSKNTCKKLRFWISNSEMCLYLCDKYQLPKVIRDLHMKNWSRQMLQLAFLENRPELAEKVREKTNLTIKNKIWYLGTKYRVLKPIILSIKNMKRFIFREDYESF